MIAKARLLSVENFSGKSKKTGNDYSMTMGVFLDLETFDKLRLSLPDDHAKSVSQHTGKDGTLSVGFDARTEKLNFVGFRAAA